MALKKLLDKGGGGGTFTPNHQHHFKANSSLTLGLKSYVLVLCAFINSYEGKGLLDMVSLIEN